MRRLVAALLAALTCLALVVAPVRPAGAALPSIAERTQGLDRKDGFLPLAWDAQNGKLYLEIPHLDTEMIYQDSLPAGVGSNDIGLDRGQLGATRLVKFVRSGPRVLLVEENTAFRAVSDSPEERAAVTDSFAQSVLWGFTIAAETDGRVLVDATEFALHDAHDVVGTMHQTQQGDFKLDPMLSAVYLPNVKAFPRNSEIEATLTFTSANPGRYVRDVSPNPKAVSVRERQSFVQLPDPGYVPRRNDPRAGYFGIAYADYAQPLGGQLEQRFVTRHRLEKKDPAAAISDPVTPIVYYVDRGVPEPIRSALVEGASWWNQAFEAAGFRNAFRVEVLPAGADPMDVRYNMIQWVHRQTRGWSYGASVVDPRTGEIIKGNVTLGSLRGRQDYLIAEGLTAPYVRGNEIAPAVEKMVLARLRQLAAHETGHTLGLAHNYLAGSEGRTSVMAYPHPLVKLTSDGHVDLSDAYTVGIGSWDKIAIAYGYSVLPQGTNEKAALEGILAAGRKRGIDFLSDQDARPPGSVHPQAHLWNNGSDAARELTRMMAVRKVALARFGETAIRADMPLATMEEALVPLYLHHRYEAEATIKMIGGSYYTYAMRGDGQTPLRPVPAADQRRALDAVLETVTPAELAIPAKILDRLPPRPMTYEPHRELFARWTGLAFDAISPAAAACDTTFALLFDPQRAARLVEQRARDPKLPSLDDVLRRTTNAVFGRAARTPYDAELARTVQRSMVERLMDLAANAPMPQVRAIAIARLAAIRAATKAMPKHDEAERAHLAMIASDIMRFEARPWTPPERREPVAAPPGMPIGEDDAFDF